MTGTGGTLGEETKGFRSKGGRAGVIMMVGGAIEEGREVEKQERS